MTIETELRGLMDEEGFLKPKEIIEWARENTDSEIYKHLEWDDAKAAEAHRLDQVRRLIVVYLRDDDGQRETISLMQDRRDGSGYRNLRPVMSNRELRRMALRQALRELRSFERRYKHLEELAAIFDAANNIGTGLDDTGGTAATAA